MKCYLCGSSDISLHTRKVRGPSKQNKICECNQCSLVFLLSNKHISNNFYKKSNMTISSEIHGNSLLSIQELIEYTRKYDERRFNDLKKQIDNKYLLDFGCGAGGFIKLLKNTAKIVHGIEVEERFHPYFKKENLNVFKQLNDIPNDIKKRGYDIITLFHVLEHIVDPLATLNELLKLLKYDGQIIIEVPNSNDALLTLYENNSYANFYYWDAHIYYYNIKTLKLLFEKLGLILNYEIKVQRFPLSNHLYWLCKGQPNGHKKWNYLNSNLLDTAYKKILGKQNRCDTVFLSFIKNN